ASVCEPPPRVEASEQDCANSQYERGTPSLCAVRKEHFLCVVNQQKRATQGAGGIMGAQPSQREQDKAQLILLDSRSGQASCP
ncbi:hypothetical protein HispidOSU_018683, partial [Sigmodon hispidus]